MTTSLFGLGFLLSIKLACCPKPLGGPTSHRDPLKEDIQWDGQQCQEAIALMKHSTDEVVVKEKMRLTMAHRQKLLHDPENSADILSVFPRFLDIPGLVSKELQSNVLCSLLLFVFVRQNVHLSLFAFTCFDCYLPNLIRLQK